MRWTGLGAVVWVVACAGSKDERDPIGLPDDTDPATESDPDDPVVTDLTDPSTDDTDASDPVTDEPLDSAGDSERPTDLLPTDATRTDTGRPVTDPVAPTDSEAPTDEEDTDEPEACSCTEFWAPVCVDGVQYVNACFARCEGETRWTNGECELPDTGPTESDLPQPSDPPEDTAAVCTCEGDTGGPVCGADGETYASACRADCEGLEWIPGECTSEPDPGPCGCPTTYEPVCGIDGENWTNACIADCHGMDYVDGPCVRDTSWEPAPDTAGDSGGAGWTSDISDAPVTWSDTDLDTAFVWETGISESWFPGDTAFEQDTSVFGDTSLVVDTGVFRETASPLDSHGFDTAPDSGWDTSGVYDTFDDSASRR